MGLLFKGQGRCNITFYFSVINAGNEPKTKLIILKFPIPLSVVTVLEGYKPILFLIFWITQILLSGLHNKLVTLNFFG